MTAMDDSHAAHNSMRILPDGVILLTETGYQTVKSSLEFAAKIETQVKDYRAQGKPALLMVDLSGITGHDSEVRDLTTKRLKSDFDAMAIITSDNITVRLITNWLVKLAAPDRRIKFFGSQAEGLAWLHQH